MSPGHCTEIQVAASEQDRSYRHVRSMVKQSCILSQYLCVFAIDFVIRKKTSQGNNFGISWGHRKLIADWILQMI